MTLAIDTVDGHGFSNEAHCELLPKMLYRIEQNFGGEKTLANLANRRQVFFANIPDEARGHAVCVVNVRHVKQGTLK